MKRNEKSYYIYVGSSKIFGLLLFCFISISAKAQFGGLRSAGNSVKCAQAKSDQHTCSNRSGSEDIVHIGTRFFSCQEVPGRIEEFCPSDGESESEDEFRGGQYVVLPEDAPVPGQRPASPKSPQKDSGAPENKSGTSASSNESGYSQQDLAREVNACNASSQEAYKCCNNPVQCGAASSSSSYLMPPTNDPEGIKQYCERMKYASLGGEQANNDAAGICYASYSSCSSACKNSQDKWQAYLPKCKAPNCSPQSVQQALSIFQMKVDECHAFKKNEQMLAAQGSSSYQNAQRSQLCANQATQPVDLASTPPNQEQPSNPIDPNSGIDCAQYPNSPACGGGYQNPGINPSNPSSLNPTDGSGSLSMEDFNTGAGIDGLPQFPQYGNYEPQQAQGTAIQNGGGGFIGSGAAAGTGFGGTTPEASNIGKNGASTDILHGEGGGGGYSSASGTGGGEEPNGSGGFSGYGSNNGNSFKNKYSGLDLKAYLPGGTKDPRRKLASASDKGTGHPDIAPMGVSMFKRISDHYALMCKLRQFMGCE